MLNDPLVLVVLAPAFSSTSNSYTLLNADTAEGQKQINPLCLHSACSPLTLLQVFVQLFKPATEAPEVKFLDALHDVHSSCFNRIAFTMKKVKTHYILL